jgi:hypothetical protein
MGYVAIGGYRFDEADGDGRAPERRTPNAEPMSWNDDLVHT